MLDEKGYSILPAMLAGKEATALEEAVGTLEISSAGTRNLLMHSWCRELSLRLRSALALSGVAVQCTLFDKTPIRNWLVPLHQDLSVPVAGRVEHPELRAWSVKEGQHFVQPPAEVLEQLLAVRLHMDECGRENGPLRVVPGSHRHGRLDGAAAGRLRDRFGEVSCLVEKGGVLMLKPLLLHASSKASSPAHRRVLHFLFAPASIGYGLRWTHAVA